MGLISLPRLNRSGVYDFWEFMWEGKYQYKHLFFNILILRDLFSEIFSFFFFKFIFRNSILSIGLNTVYPLNLTTKPTLYFSKIWILRFQKWFIVVSYYYNLTYFFKKKSKRVSKNFKYKVFFKLSENYKFKF